MFSYSGGNEQRFRFLNQIGSINLDSRSADPQSAQETVSDFRFQFNFCQIK